MFKTLVNAFKTKDLRNKIIITLVLLLVYRIGCWLPIPGVDVSVFEASVKSDNGFLSLLSSISGGALANGAIFALGVSPYINASIIVQLLSFAIPSMQQLSKQGDEGKKKLGLYTRIAALIMATAQAIGIVIAFSQNESLYSSIFVGAPTWITGVIVVLVLVAGGMFTLWLGEKITESGVGNGLSLILLVGILSTAGTGLFSNIEMAFAGNISYVWNLLIFIFAVIVIFGLIVWVDAAERKIPVQYSNQMRGRMMYQGQSTHIPLKINGSGVMPIIFTMAIVAFPQIIMGMFGLNSEWYNTWMGAGSWVYIVITSVLIFAFSFFYNSLIFNPEDVSRQIQQNGGFIPGIRPGKPTADYLKRISNRMTFFGAMFLALLALIPSLVFKGIGGLGGAIENSVLVNAFSATGLLIVVSVALEFNKQLEAQMLMKSYRGFLK